MALTKGTVDSMRQDGTGFKMGDTWYKISNEYDGPKIERGLSVEIEYSQSEWKGKTYYWANAGKLLRNGQESLEMSAHEVAMNRRTALMQAVELCKLRAEAAGSDVVLSVADQFDAWLSPGEPPEPDVNDLVPTPTERNAYRGDGGYVDNASGDLGPQKEPR